MTIPDPNAGKNINAASNQDKLISVLKLESGSKLPKYDMFFSDSSIEEYEITERNRAIQDTVNNMGKPCAPLLLKFYWDQLSWDIIAQQLGYANANSAKTQKNKCMNKLKNLFKA
jgi:hypothetical protein